MPPTFQEILFIVTTPGLEPAVARECRQLGLTPQEEAGGVTVETGAGEYRRLNLLLRAASRILLRVGGFLAHNRAQLEQGIRTLKLGDFRETGEPIDLSCSSHGSRINASSLKDLATRVLGGTRMKQPAADDLGFAPRLHLRLDKDFCTASVDTSGELLYRRGYRQEISRAPLRETLAAGMLILAGYDGEEPLWDPLCGSGTLPIEGALLSSQRPPGLSRSFAWERFPALLGSARDEQERLRKDLAGRTRPIPQPILATDLHAGALGAARRNARRAGVADSIRFERMDALGLTAPFPQGLLVANLPYGKRVGEVTELAAFYRRFGQVLQEKFPRWRKALLVPDETWVRALEFSAVTSYPVDNGGIRCLLMLADPRK